MILQNQENRERLEDIARMRSEGVISSSIDEQMQSASAALAEREEAGADFEAYQPATAYSGSQSPSSGYMVVGQLPDTNQGKVEYNGEVYTWMEDLGQYIQGDF